MVAQSEYTWQHLIFALQDKRNELTCKRQELFHSAKQLLQVSILINADQRYRSDKSITRSSNEIFVPGASGTLFAHRNLLSASLNNTYLLFSYVSAKSVAKN